LKYIIECSDQPGQNLGLYVLLCGCVACANVDVQPERHVRSAICSEAVSERLLTDPAVRPSPHRRGQHALWCASRCKPTVPVRRPNPPLMGKPAAPSYRTIQVGASTHIEGPLLAYMNHSCRPSAIIMTRQLSVRAWTALKCGEEVTFFYPSTEWKMVRPFHCLCGAPDCIKYVAGAEKLPVDLLARYHLNPHVRKPAAQALAHATVRWSTNHKELAHRTP
jgi:SET domain